MKTKPSTKFLSHQVCGVAWLRRRNIFGNLSLLSRSSIWRISIRTVYQSSALFSELSILGNWLDSNVCTSAQITKQMMCTTMCLHHITIRREWRWTKGMSAGWHKINWDFTRFRANSVDQNSVRDDIPGRFKFEEQTTLHTNWIRDYLSTILILNSFQAAAKPWICFQQWKQQENRIMKFFNSNSKNKVSSDDGDVITKSKIAPSPYLTRGSFFWEKNVLNVESKTRKATHDGKRSRRQVHNLRNECWEIDTKDNKALRGKTSKKAGTVGKILGYDKFATSDDAVEGIYWGNKRK